MGDITVHFDTDGKHASFTSQVSPIQLEERKLEDGTKEHFGTVTNAIYEGSFNHHQGDFVLTDKTLDEFVSNFENNRAGIQPAINYNHQQFDKAAGWPTKVVKRISEKALSDGKTSKTSSLDMEVKWTPSAAQAIRDGEYRYFSIEFATDFVNSETQEKVKNVITGGALTNKPFLKKTSVMALEDKKIEEKQGGKPMQKDEMLLSLKKDFDLDVAKLQSDSVALSESKKEITKLSEKVETLESEKQEMLKKQEEEKIESLLSECIKSGKITKHQGETVFKTAFLSVGLEKAEEMVKELGQAMKLEPKGSSASTEESETELSYSEKLDKAANKLAKEKEISYSDALAELEYKV